MAKQQEEAAGRGRTGVAAGPGRGGGGGGRAGSGRVGGVRARAGRAERRVWGYIVGTSGSCPKSCGRFGVKNARAE